MEQGKLVPDSSAPEASHAPLQHLLGGEAVEGRGGDIEVGEVEVELPSVVAQRYCQMLWIEPGAQAA